MLPSIKDAIHGQANCVLVLSYFLLRYDPSIMFQPAENRKQFGAGLNRRRREGKPPNGRNWAPSSVFLI